MSDQNGPTSDFDKNTNNNWKWIIAAILVPILAAIIPIIISREKPSTEIVVAAPSCEQPLLITTDESVVLRLRWGSLIEDGLLEDTDSITFDLIVDGQRVDTINRYRQSVEEYNSFARYGCGPDEFGYWVHWDVPLGTLSVGMHNVSVDYILAEPLYDGIAEYPAGPLGAIETEFVVEEAN